VDAGSTPLIVFDTDRDVLFREQALLAQLGFPRRRRDRPAGPVLSGISLMLLIVPRAEWKSCGCGRSRRTLRRPH
jgi:hypothetical protein